MTRRLGLLKAHGIIKKVQKTHRHELTAYGKRLATTLLAAQNWNADTLTAE